MPLSLIVIVTDAKPRVGPKIPVGICTSHARSGITFNRIFKSEFKGITEERLAYYCLLSQLPSSYKISWQIPGYPSASAAPRSPATVEKRTHLFFLPTSENSCLGIR